MLFPVFIKFINMYRVLFCIFIITLSCINAFAQHRTKVKNAYLFNVNVQDCSACIAFLGNVKFIDLNKYDIFYVFSKEFSEDKQLIISTLGIDTTKSNLIFNDSIYNMHTINGQSSYLVIKNNTVIKKGLIKNEFGSELVNYFNAYSSDNADTLLYSGDLFYKSASHYFVKDNYLYFKNMFGGSINRVDLTTGNKISYQIDKEQVLKTYDLIFSKEQQSKIFNMLKLGNIKIEPTMEQYFVSEDKDIYICATLPYAEEHPNGLDTTLLSFYAIYKLGLNGAYKSTHIFEKYYVDYKPAAPKENKRFLIAPFGFYVRQDTLYTTIIRENNGPIVDDRYFFARFYLDNKTKRCDYSGIEKWQLPSNYDYMGYNIINPVFSNNYKYYMLPLENMLYTTGNSNISTTIDVLKYASPPQSVFEIKEVISHIAVQNTQVYVISTDFKDYYYSVKNLKTGKLIKDRVKIFSTDNDNKCYNIILDPYDPDYILQVMNKNTIIRRNVYNE